MMQFMSGILLATERSECCRRRFVHNETDSWEITSDIPIERVPHVAIMNRRLPGRLGSFIYPHDAVFTLKGASKTTHADFDVVIVRERSKRASTGHLNHISVSEQDLNEDVGCPSDEEDDESETDDDEVDEQCGEGEEGAQWDEDDDVAE